MPSRAGPGCQAQAARWQRTRSRGPAIAVDGANHGHEPCRFDKILHRYISDYERHHAELDAEYPERGTRCDTNISNNGNEQRASGHLHTMEPLGSGVHQRVRHSGHKRELHGAAESSFACERDADSAKRGRSFETDFCRGVHHQQFFVATLCAIQRAGRRDGNDCGDLDARPRLEPKPCAVLGAKRSGLQRKLLRNIDRGHDAIDERKFRSGFGEVHRARDRAKS